VDKPVVQQGGAGDVIASGESFCVRLKVARDEIVTTEQRLAPRAEGPPLHFYRRHSDSFFVLSGRVAVRLDQMGVLHLTNFGRSRREESVCTAVKGDILTSRG
jgi:hypothetical protein